MAADTVVTLPPVVVNQTNLEKIENFLNDAAYKEVIESSNNFNTRLNVERRMRLPFIDNQTGVAQNPCSLFMAKRQRLPGLLPGQIYSYPRQRWRKKRRQYLTMSARAYARAAEGIIDGENDIHNISQIENPALQDTDSKDSQFLKDEMPKEWFYDEQDMLEMDAYDDPDPDSDLDYEETYRGRKRGKGRGGRGGRGGGVDSPSTPGRKRGTGRGRGKKGGFGGHNYEPSPGDPDKPFACELCGARYKTRPGLTYHYGHSHKEGASDENSRDSNATSTPPTGGTPTPPQTQPCGPGAVPPQLMSGVGDMSLAQPGGAPPPAGNQPGAAASAAPPPGGGIDVAPMGTASPSGGHVYQDSYVSFLNQSPGTPVRRGRPLLPSQHSPTPPGQGPPMAGPMGGPSVVGGAPPTLPPNLPGQPPMGQGEDPPMPVLKPEKLPEGQGPSGGPLDSQPLAGPLDNKKSVAPSPYCDFCLGDSTQNKKTGGVEELVSCSDCGRSGEEIRRLRAELRAGRMPDIGPQMPNIGPIEGSMSSSSWQSAESSSQMAEFGPPSEGPAVNIWQGENANFGPMSNVGHHPSSFSPMSHPSHSAHMGPMPNVDQYGNYDHPSAGFRPMPMPNHPPNYGPMSNFDSPTHYGPMSYASHPGNVGPMPQGGHSASVTPPKVVKTPGKRGRKKKVQV